MSRIITFYSYKGGVGRTFALANIAVLLAKRGKRVLLMDWDLEAPGLHRYFKGYGKIAAPRQEGLVHLLGKAVVNPNVAWQSYITKVKIPECLPMDLIASGDQASDYVECVRKFSWNTFFELYAGGELLDRWRREWKSLYDFVLVDSRTGLTDTGGVCTIYLPDILVLVFSANEQSFERGVQVAKGVQKARRDLSVQRPPLAVLPLPGRFDGRDEIDEAQVWLNRFAEELKPFYDDWLPKELKPRQILELTKVPYVTKFSFGEPLPVITQGVTDPEFPGYYLENVARLLISDFQDARQIVSPERDDHFRVVAELRSVLASVPIDEGVVAQSIAAIENEIGSSPMLSEFLTEAGVALLRQQRHGAAESYLRRALAISTETLGPSHPLALSGINDLAELLSTTGRLSEAEMLYRQLVKTAEKFDSPTRIASYNSLANICRMMGRTEEAVRWYERSLHLAEMIGGPGDPAVLTTISNLAGVHRTMGRTEEAVRWYEHALHLAERTGGPDDPAMLTMFNNLAGVYREMGRTEEAVRWYERALHFAERTGGPGNPAMLATINNLASVFREMGQADKAVDWYKRALHLAERTGGPGDPAMFATINNLAGVFREAGRTDEAVRWYEHALELAEKTGSPGAPAILGIINNLGEIYTEAGRTEEAVNWYKRALWAAENDRRPGDPATLNTYNNLAAIYRETGKIQQSLTLYRTCLEVATATFGAGSRQVAAQLSYLAEALTEIGQFGEAESLLRRALEIFDNTLGDDSPITARSKASLARLLTASGRSKEAAAITDTARFDVFFSYSPRDSTVVELLAQKLTERGLRVWLDRWHLRPGDSTLPAITDAISSSASVLVCIGSTGPDRWMEEESEAILSYHPGQRIVPVLLPGADPDQIPPFLRTFRFLDMRGGLTDERLDHFFYSISNRRRASK